MTHITLCGSAAQDTHLIVHHLFVDIPKREPRTSDNDALNLVPKPMSGRQEVHDAFHGGVDHVRRIFRSE